MGAEDRMLGRNRPVGCPTCRTADVGPDCLDRGKSRHEARKAEKRTTAHDIDQQLADDQDVDDLYREPEPAWAWAVIQHNRRFRPAGVEQFDTEASMGYVQVRPNSAGFSHTLESRHVAMDYDTRGRLIGYELLREPVETLADECVRCERVFHGGGGNVCTDCLGELLGLS